MHNDHLNALAVLNIESELTSSINYDSIIKELAESQSRKKNVNVLIIYTNTIYIHNKK